VSSSSKEKDAVPEQHCGGCYRDGDLHAPDNVQAKVTKPDKDSVPGKLRFVHNTPRTKMNRCNRSGVIGDNAAGKVN
jgi:hypothetical protein